MQRKESRGRRPAPARATLVILGSLFNLTDCGGGGIPPPPPSPSLTFLGNTRASVVGGPTLPPRNGLAQPTNTLTINTQTAPQGTGSRAPPHSVTLVLGTDAGANCLGSGRGGEERSAGQRDATHWRLGQRDGNRHPHLGSVSWFRRPGSAARSPARHLRIHRLHGRNRGCPVVERSQSCHAWRTTTLPGQSIQPGPQVVPGWLPVAINKFDAVVLINLTCGAQEVAR